MPLKGEHRAELLSAYLDGELSESESELVVKELAQDESLRTDLAELEEQQTSVRAFFDTAGSAATSTGRMGNLRENILSSIADKEPAPQQETASVAPPANDTPANVGWIALAAVAASLMLGAAIFSEQLMPKTGNGNNLAQDPTSLDPSVETTDPNSNPFDLSDDPALAGKTDILPTDLVLPGSGGSESVEYVSEINFGGLYYVMVFDVVMTEEAVENDALGKIFEECKIAQQPPILLDQESNQKIQETRMTVREGEELDSDATMYFIRADLVQLGKAIDKIDDDAENFPVSTLDLAVDDPQVRLMESIAKSTGQRFAIGEKFAAPLSLRPEDVGGSRFSDFHPPERLVSRESRNSPGRIEFPAPLAGDSQQPSTALLIIYHR